MYELQNWINKPYILPLIKPTARHILSNCFTLSSRNNFRKLSSIHLIHVDNSACLCRSIAKKMNGFTLNSGQNLGTLSISCLLLKFQIFGFLLFNCLPFSIISKFLMSLFQYPAYLCDFQLSDLLISMFCLPPQFLSLAWWATSCRSCFELVGDGLPCLVELTLK